MVPPFSHRIPRARRYSGYNWLPSLFAYETFTLCGVPSQVLPLRYRNAVMLSEPRKYFYSRFGLFRVRSPLLTKSRLISFPSPTKMFKFRRCLPVYLYSRFQYTVTEVHSAGFPHSEIHGSKVAFTSPWLIADRCVLHRLQVPRHSPCALFSLTIIESFGSHC